jgi:plastocyanin
MFYNENIFYVLQCLIAYTISATFILCCWYCYCAVTASFTVYFANGWALHQYFHRRCQLFLEFRERHHCPPLTNPSTSYLSPGTYTVTLTASGGGSSSTQTMVITVYPLPTVDFFASVTAVCPGGPVTFTNTSTPGVPAAMTCLWNFGDAVTSTAANSTHAFTNPGYYNISLAVTNSHCCLRVHTFTCSIFMSTNIAACLGACKAAS